MDLGAMLRPRTTPRTTFPIAEGFGIFVGIVAWDLMIDGHMDLIKAVLIAGPSSLVWFALRYWRGKKRGKPR